MRILLINPPYIGWLNDIKVEPLGLLYIASSLRDCGHDVRLYDAYMDEPIDNLVDHILQSNRARAESSRASARVSAKSRGRPR